MSNCQHLGYKGPEPGNCPGCGIPLITVTNEMFRERRVPTGTNCSHMCTNQGDSYCKDCGTALPMDPIVGNKPWSKDPDQRPISARSALDIQVGGDHYKGQKIQPIEYIQANGLTFCEGNAVKYITRHRAKGKRQDLEKAIHYLQLEIEHTYGSDKS